MGKNNVVKGMLIVSSKLILLPAKYVICSNRSDSLPSDISDNNCKDIMTTQL